MHFSSQILNCRVSHPGLLFVTSSVLGLDFRNSNVNVRNFFANYAQVVIYAQFRTLSRIVARICHGEGWEFVYLTGDSTLEHRTKAIRRFREDPNIKILIAGLKCGGLG